ALVCGVVRVPARKLPRRCTNALPVFTPPAGPQHPLTNDCAHGQPVQQRLPAGLAIERHGDSLDRGALLAHMVTVTSLRLPLTRMCAGPSALGRYPLRSA